MVRIRKHPRKIFINLLIFIGISTIIAASFRIYYLWNYQQKFLGEENPIIINDSKDDFIYTQKPNPQDIKPTKETFNRSQYKSGMMKISIPKLKVDAAIVEGTSTELLKKGPGLYEISPLPDKDGGNVCIAGHRTTYGAWFKKVNELVEGDEISLSFNNTNYIYKVEKVFIIKNNDWSVTHETGYSALTLTSCHPLRSSAQRIVVRAKLSNIIQL